jgi:hypothetical protein
MAGHIKHGHTLGKASRTYASWSQMKVRCLNKTHHKYPRYGGRGIKICERWLTFANFLEDMGERPTGTTLDRKENDGDYELSNCQWSTPLQQAANRSCSVWITIDGVTKLMRHWCIEYSTTEPLVSRRLKAGMAPIEALTRPSRIHNGRRANVGDQ